MSPEEVEARLATIESELQILTVTVQRLTERHASLVESLGLWGRTLFEAMALREGQR